MNTGTRNNILISSVGKRVSLVREFQTELKKVFPRGKVFTTELNPEMSPAARISDGCFRVPRVTAPEYIDVLFRICAENGIRVVVPTIDTELLVLAQAKERFAATGISLLVADEDFISVCRDKRNTGMFFEAHGIRVPAPVDKHSPTFPLFAKPYDGSLSKDLFVVRSREDLTPEILNHPKLIFMEYIDKRIYSEYTVDMYFGRDNRIKAVVPRERIEIRAGEINKGRTRKNVLESVLRERLSAELRRWGEFPAKHCERILARRTRRFFGFLAKQHGHASLRCGNHRSRKAASRRFRFGRHALQGGGFFALRISRNRGIAHGDEWGCGGLTFLRNA